MTDTIIEVDSIGQVELKRGDSFEINVIGASGGFKGVFAAIGDLPAPGPSNVGVAYYVTEARCVFISIGSIWAQSTIGSFTEAETTMLTVAHFNGIRIYNSTLRTEFQSDGTYWIADHEFVGINIAPFDVITFDGTGAEVLVRSVELTWLLKYVGPYGALRFVDDDSRTNNSLSKTRRNRLATTTGITGIAIFSVTTNSISGQFIDKELRNQGSLTSQRGTGAVAAGNTTTGGSGSVTTSFNYESNPLYLNVTAQGVSGDTGNTLVYRTLRVSVIPGF